MYVRMSAAIIAAWTAALGGCVGEIGSPGNGEPAACGVAPRPGPSPIRRLTRFEYDNTVRDLLGDDSQPSRDFPPEEEALGFNNNAATLGVTQLLAEQYMVAAEGIAQRATEGDKLGELLGCDPAAVDDTCVSAFASRFGQRAWRRPLAADEAAEMVALFRAAREPYDVATGVQVVIQAFLQSPHFLYRVEFGAPANAGDAVIPLGDHEMASRLSYFLWGTMPDDALFAAAAAGQLRTAEQIAAQAQRMLADPRARAAVRNFHTQWLKLDLVTIASKDPALFDGFTPAVKTALREESLAFLDDVIWEGDATVERMLTAPYTMMNATLAEFYGATGPTGDAFERVELDPSHHAGVLSRGGLMAGLAKPNQTSPVLRGKFVREQLLCTELPSPPNDMQIDPPPLSRTLTTRERFAQHRTVASCAACHALIDPIGLGLENLDGIGRWRDRENNKVIDATGEVTSLTGPAGPVGLTALASPSDGRFNGPLELGRRLAGSDRATECLVETWFAFGLGREPVTEDACSLDVMKRRFVGGGRRLRELVLALTETDAFHYRRTGGTP
jgi:hypothetical protein